MNRLSRFANRWFGPTAKTETEKPIDAAVIVKMARRLQFRVRPTSVSALAGAYLGARPGLGLTFSELRAYEPGDEVRHIDWNVTARQGRPYVRRFVEERLLTLWLVVDVSASMRFGPPGKAKADRAAQAAALLAAAAIQNGDCAGLLLMSDRIEAEVVPGQGARHLSGILRTLVTTPVVSRRTSLQTGLQRIQHRSRHSLILVLSDFLDLESDPTWLAMAKRHELVAVRIVDPREEVLPPVGLISLEAAETGQGIVIDSASARVRSAYAQAAAQRANAFKTWCLTREIGCLSISTNADPLGPLLRYFQGRPIRHKNNRQ